VKIRLSKEKFRELLHLMINPMIPEVESQKKRGPYSEAQKQSQKKPLPGSRFSSLHPWVGQWVKTAAVLWKWSIDKIIPYGTIWITITII
jgi:hypothetical protein